MKKFSLLLLLSVFLLNACIGDRKTAIGTDFNDTSFENKNFKGNKIEYANIKEPCNYITKKEIANLYEVSQDRVILISADKGCSIRIKMSDEKFDYITGVISFYEELDTMPDGTSWIETWQVQKGISKSASWIPNLGKADFFKKNKRELRIKFENYILSIVAPGSPFNQIEKAKNRDYKKIALAMANKIPFFKK